MSKIARKDEENKEKEMENWGKKHTYDPLYKKLYS